jgi:hypothetical protein
VDKLSKSNLFARLPLGAGIALAAACHLLISSPATTAPRRRAAALKHRPATTHTYNLRSTRGKAQVRTNLVSAMSIPLPTSTVPPLAATDPAGTTAPLQATASTSALVPNPSLPLGAPAAPRAVFTPEQMTGPSSTSATAWLRCG